MAKYVYGATAVFQFATAVLNFVCAFMSTGVSQGIYTATGVLFLACTAVFAVMCVGEIRDEAEARAFDRRIRHHEEFWS